MPVVYDLVYAAAALATSPLWAYRLLRSGKWKTDWPGRFGRTAVDPRRRPGPRIVFHAVSVGEIAAMRCLVDHLHHHHPQINLIIASTTNTGYERAQSLYADRHHVVRYPFDFSFADRAFLDVLKPDLLVLVELEVWPNMLNLCAQRRIPVAVVNGRLSQRSFHRYNLIRPLVKASFARLAAAAVQTQAYAERFRALGAAAERIHVLDTMKWDTAAIAEHVSGSAELAAELGINRERPLIVAGSTGPGEEKMLIAACPPNAQLLLVPRKPERFNEVASLAPHIVRRTGAAAHADPGQRLFLLDTMGELTKAYALADLVVVGRSFNGLGGSDPIEPIALGKPTIIGPDHHNFAEVVAALRDNQGIRVTTDPAGALAELLRDPDKAAALACAGREVILSRQGATRRHAELLIDLLADADARRTPANQPAP